MKKLPVIITFTAIALLCAVLYFYLVHWKKSPITAWDLIPAEAIAVYESSDCQDCLFNLAKSPAVELLSGSIRSCDSILKPQEFLTIAGNLTSLHKTQKQSLEIIRYFNSPQSIIPLLEKKKSEPGFTYSNHTYNGSVLHEIKTKTQFITWTSLDNILVLTTSPVLMEDVIRTFNHEAASFKSELANVFTLPRVSKDAGNLYVSLHKLPRLLQSFTKLPVNNLLANLGKASLLDVRSSRDALVLNGFSTDSAASGSILSFFKNQAPVPIQIMPFVSNKTAYLHHFGISNGAEFRLNLPKLQNDTLLKVMKDYKLDPQSLIDGFQGELATLSLEPGTNGRSMNIALMRTRNQQGWITAMTTLAEKLSIDTIHHETFGNWEIRQIPISRFLAGLFQPLLINRDYPFYAQSGELIVFAESAENLRQYLDDIESEETWGKTVSKTRFLESTLTEASISFYLNPLSTTLEPDESWKKQLQKYRLKGGGLGLAALQFSYLNNTFYTNFALDNTSTTEERSSDSEWSVSFTQPIANFWPVKNHQDKSQEILVQDSTGNISLIAQSGKIHWTRKLDLITTEVYQVDYLNNGKLQMCFATKDQLFIVDRNGKDVNPFPIKLKESPVYLSVIDYDRSRKYRFLLTSKSGKIWMYDKEGSLLEGWNPKKLDEKPISSPRHFRIGAKDYLVAITPNGKAWMFTRKGDLLPGFPLNLEARPTGDFTYDQNSGTEAAFVVVSREGTRVRFTPAGKVLSSDPILKSKPDSRFTFVPEYQGSGYRIVRFDNETGTLFNQQLEELGASDFLGSNPMKWRFTDEGAAGQFLVATDETEDLTMIFDGSGKPIIPIPIPSHALWVRGTTRNQKLVFYAFGAILTCQKLN